MNLNVGGIVGGSVCALAAFYLSTKNINPDQSQKAISKVVIIAIVAGAIGGNFIWSLFTGEKSSKKNK